jgi:FkbM family methyltransferase
MSEIKQIWRPISGRLTERAWQLLFTSASNRRIALRHLFHRHMAPNALAFITFDDHSFFVDPRDQMIAFRLLSGHSWQRAEFDAAIMATEAADVLKPGKWFVDVGANIGTQTVYAMRSGRFCGAIAIEPEPHNLDLLRRNIAINGLSDTVHIVAAAASDRNATATLTRDRQNFGAHSIKPNWSDTPGTAVTVETRSLDSVIAQLGIAASDIGLVWIDVEGHEVDALRGMEQLRRTRVPIVSEVSSTADVEALRALLAPDYTSAQQLQPKPAVAEHSDVAGSHAVNGSGSVPVGSGRPQRRSAANRTDAGIDIATFEFGARQTDVLIYHTASHASATI